MVVISYWLFHLYESHQINEMGLDEDESVRKWEALVGNIPAHYFNDDPGRHSQCANAGFQNCPVLQGRSTNFLHVLAKAKLVSDRPKQDVLAILSCVGKHGCPKIGMGAFEGDPAKILEEAGTPGPLIPLEKVKCKLADGKWLGERCQWKEQHTAFRQLITELFTVYADPHFGKKCLRGNDTQKNEAVHSAQAKVMRKDGNVGVSTNYRNAQAVGVLMFDQKANWIVRVAEKMGLRLSPETKKWVEEEVENTKRRAAYQASKEGKLKRKQSKAALHRAKKLGGGAGVHKDGDYVSRGGGLEVISGF